VNKPAGSTDSTDSQPESLENNSIGNIDTIITATSAKTTNTISCTPLFISGIANKYYVTRSMEFGKVKLNLSKSAADTERTMQSMQSMDATTLTPEGGSVSG